MNFVTLKKSIKGVDIYILDQILKGRYQAGAKILDAGCGNGRNLKWFYQQGFEIYGTDMHSGPTQTCKELYPTQKEYFTQATVEQLPYKSNNFNHVICNAVLHFAKDLSHFSQMFDELLRVLKPHGTLFIRTASIFGLENEVIALENGNYKLPDGSTRFLLTATILEEIQNRNEISFIEDVKTTIVHSKRCMTTLMIEKKE
ncbi:class I SAM-dependent methyltransferase [Lutibacter flavus]|uniref:Methyltransferase domain-containing protein n=1 Tax=Lutibacter flavus TaxID=691689 RepID=A0A238VN17_9FLAO|nr:class I SAM-dependent methyltransferase [Lutibacter flavus]SNR35537.1 Methyltransferase domain-containing protein [Lutibacter flavus]